MKHRNHDQPAIRHSSIEAALKAIGFGIEKSPEAAATEDFNERKKNQPMQNVTNFPPKIQSKNDNTPAPFFPAGMDPQKGRCDKWGYPTMGSNGLPEKTLSNVVLALQKDPLFAGAFAFDEMAAQCLTTRPTPGGPAGTITDTFVSKIAIWLQFSELKVTSEIVGEAIQVVCRENSFHPVADYLAGLQWDGRRRLDTWLQFYLKADGNPDYLAAVGSKWMISAVARAMRPGCKVDTMLIFEGTQGAGKSTVLDILGGKWFSDGIRDLASKDTSQLILRGWIVEIPELDAMRKAEATATKSFVTRRIESFRLPYGKITQDFPRSCVFAGTTNATSYLKDETGGRRFWPVACGTIRVDELRRDRDQLWAEAVVRYLAGEQWWLDTAIERELAAPVQAERIDSDPWQETVVRWLEFKDAGEPITAAAIMGGPIGIPLKDLKQADKNRVAAILTGLGYEKTGKRTPKSEGRAPIWELRGGDVS